MQNQKVRMNLGTFLVANKVIALFVLSVLIVFCACRKELKYDPTKEVKRHFFKSNTQAFQIVQDALYKIHPGERLEVIESISYSHSSNHSYAFVFYKSNKESNNLVIQRDYDEDENLIGGGVVSCEGSQCNCRVKGIFGQDGTITLECTCPDLCSKIITP